MIAFLLQLLVFLFAIIFCFTLPGLYLLKNLKSEFDTFTSLTISTVLGLVFFSLLSYLLLVLNIHILLLPITILVNILTILMIHHDFKSFSSKINKNFIIFLIAFLSGVFFQLAVISPSGVIQNNDLIFYSSHAHDSAWHIALMNELQKGYPLQNPTLSGEKLVNYHFFSDIAPADFNKFFKLNSLDLYFRFFPLLYSILLGSLAFILGKNLTKSFSSGLWAMFFTYFAGSFGYILTWLRSKEIAGESMFWASQIHSSIGNPPQILSFILFLAFLFLLYKLLEKPSLLLIFVLSILLASLAIVKVYGFVVLITALSIISLLRIIKDKKFDLLSVLILGGLISLPLYLPNSSGSTGFLIWEPWWYIRTMIVVSDKLDWLDLEHKRQTYIFENNWKRVAQIELTGFLIFLFGNIGMRTFAFIYFLKNLKKLFQDYIYLLSFLIILVSIILPLLFLQKGVASNSIQFFQYALLLLGLWAGFSITYLLSLIKYKIVRFIIIILIILFAIPTQVGLLNSFYNRQPFTKITSQELEALKFLNQNFDQNSIVLTPPYNKYLETKETVPPIWDWSDTGYVSAFSNKRTYLSDTEQVDIMGYDFKSRLTFQQKIFQETDSIDFENDLNKNNINIIYFPKKVSPSVDLSLTNLKRVFDNNYVEIWSLP